MIKNLFVKLGSAVTFVLSTAPIFSGSVAAQSYTLPPDLKAKIDSHPHARQLTNWGSRPDWSPDSKHLLFISKQFGDVFELDVESGKTRPLTFHFSHDGVLRAYYLANGDILLTGPRDHTPGTDGYARVFEAEMWLMKSDLSSPPVSLGERNMEGAAVSRNSMRIAWAKPVGSTPSKMPDSEMAKLQENMAIHANQIWLSDISDASGSPKLINNKMLLDCASTKGALAQMAARAGGRCVLIEPQNFVPTDDSRLTFTMLTQQHADKRIEANSYILDLRTNKISELEKSNAYAEVEGVFPDGKSSLVEYYDGVAGLKATESIDLWRLNLDGAPALKRVTNYNKLDSRLKSNQGVVSPDGRWLAYGVSTGEIEKKAPGQGIGLFLLDLKASGF